MASQGLQDGSACQDRAGAGPHVDLGEVEHIQGVTMNGINKFLFIKFSQKCLPGVRRWSCPPGSCFLPPTLIRLEIFFLLLSGASSLVIPDPLGQKNHYLTIVEATAQGGVLVGLYNKIYKNIHFSYQEELWSLDTPLLCYSLETKVFKDHETCDLDFDQDHF